MRFYVPVWPNTWDISNLFEWYICCFVIGSGSVTYISWLYLCVFIMSVFVLRVTYIIYSTYMDVGLSYLFAWGKMGCVLFLDSCMLISCFSPWWKYDYKRLMSSHICGETLVHIRKHCFKANYLCARMCRCCGFSCWNGILWYSSDACMGQSQTPFGWLTSAFVDWDVGELPTRQWFILFGDNLGKHKLYLTQVKWKK